MTTVSKASLDDRALAMMSNTYFFELRNPIHPLLKTVGNARVIGVVINESCAPELLLKSDREDPAFYSIDDLSFSSAISLAS